MYSLQTREEIRQAFYFLSSQDSLPSRNTSDLIVPEAGATSWVIIPWKCCENIAGPSSGALRICTVNPCTSQELRAPTPHTRKSASTLASTIGLGAADSSNHGLKRGLCIRDQAPMVGVTKILLLARGWLSPWMQNLADRKSQLYLFKNQCVSELHSAKPCCSRGNSFCVPGEADGEGWGSPLRTMFHCVA